MDNQEFDVDVVNAVGTSELEPPSGYDSWLDYWEKKQGKKADHCYFCGKKTEDLLGGHVNKVILDYTEIILKKKPKSEPPLFIIPLCAECNNSENDAVFSVSEADLVPAPDEYNVVDALWP
jgi:hypothetical protein